MNEWVVILYPCMEKILILIVEVKILIVGSLIQYTQVLWIKNVLIFVQV